MRCSKCGADNRETRKFCAQCGAPLAAKCPQCGASNEMGGRFCGDCGAALYQPAIGPRSTEPEAAHHVGEHGELWETGEGERRHLTVMFCDVVGSTALSEKLDPEELRELMRSYQRLCVAAITSFDGYVAHYLGDGVLAYFGYPSAHEDDPVRAVRAGLAIAEKARTAQFSHPIHVRIGIHTGLVVAGEMGSGEYLDHRAIVGETPNIAARLQDQAPHDGVVISPATYRLVAGLFECEDLGPRTLKGISAPLSIYRVLRESEARSRFEVAVKTGLTPLVGREHELGHLRARWQDAQRGEGRVVLLCGEPGIGKSRLMQTLAQEALAEGATRIEFRCSPYHRNSAFYPIIDHLQRLLGFERDELPESRLDKLARMLSTYRFPEPDTLPLLASLLSLPQPANAVPLTMSPQKQKQKTGAALIAWTIEESERTPVYYVWEDLHWADPSSLELFPLLLDQIPATRLFWIMTFRPEFRPPWPPREHISQMMLHGLDRPEVEALVEGVTDGKPLPPEVVREVVNKTDGVPLFVEELTRTVMESGALREQNGRYELTSPLRTLEIPSSLNDSLTARLDRLGAAREVAQLASALGREFSYEMLEAVAPLDEAALKGGLDRLVDAEILHQRGLPPQSHYIFRHGLIQDAAHQSLLRSTRQKYHKHIALTLEQRFAEIKATQPELLAGHYTEAGLVAEAIPYWLQAGQVAARRSAHVEAINHLTSGLDLLATLPDGPARAQQELAFQTAMGTSLLATKGFAASEPGAAYQRALVLCRQIGETPQLFPVLAGLRFFYTVQGELRTGREIGEQLLRLAENTGDSGLILEAHYGLGSALFYLGEFVSAREHFEESIVLHDSLQQRRFLAGIGMEAGVASRCVAAWVLWPLGYPDEALEKAHEALTIARKLSHPYSLLYALSFAAAVHTWRGEGQTGQQLADAAITLAREQGFPSWVAVATFNRGYALSAQGKQEEAIAQMMQGATANRAVSARSSMTGFFSGIVPAYLKTGQTDEAAKLLAEGLGLVEKDGQRYWEARLYELNGQLMRIRGQDAEAEQNYRTSIRIAEGQSTQSLKLSATTALARLLRDAGRREEARVMLAEIYNWFTEGFDTTDLRDAEALLDELSA